MTPTELSPTYTHRFLLTAAEVDAQRRMPLSRLVTTIIDVATAHANRIGIGFDHLIKHDLSWVLSRLAIDIDRMPEVNHTYLFHTWVESVNRMFSERCFEMVDADSGERVLTAHSVWMVIGMASRRPGDILSVWSHPELVSDRPYPGSKCGKLLPPAAAERESSYTFAVSDIDVNRHVTTRRYIDLFVDLWSLDHYDTHTISRFEVAFKHEARYGDKARTAEAPAGAPGVYDLELSVEGTPCCLARIHFTPSQQSEN